MPAEETLAASLADGLAIPFEGFSSRPYRDPVGVWTIGYGSTRDASGDPVGPATEAIGTAEAKLLLTRDMHAAFEEIARDVKVPLNAFQKGALADLIYNIGLGNFRASTLLKRLNVKDYAGAASEIDRWNMAGGKVLAGLVRRRQAETDLFKKS
jgi:lysozyme